MGIMSARVAGDLAPTIAAYLVEQSTDLLRRSVAPIRLDLAGVGVALTRRSRFGALSADAHIKREHFVPTIQKPLPLSCKSALDSHERRQDRFAHQMLQTLICCDEFIFCHRALSMSKRPLKYKTVKRYNVPGHAHFLTFSCYHRAPLLTDERRLTWRGESVEAACKKCRMSLWAYVFMPDHVHLLVKPMIETYRIQDFLKAAKQPVAIRILNALRKDGSTLLRELMLPDHGCSGRYRVWQAGGGYDYNVWSISKALEKARYCHRNPVVRGLVEDPSDWRWSSYRQIEMGMSGDAPLHIDSWSGDFSSPEGRGPCT